MKNPSLATFVLCGLHWFDLSSKPEELFLLSIFSTQTPSEISQRHALCSVFNHFPKVMKSSESCALTLATASTFPLLRLATETKFDLHSPARLEYLKFTLRKRETRVQLLSLLDALYAEVLHCTLCRNLTA
jgi:hypothetical protein